MGEDEGGAGDVADLAGAGGDVLQDPPAAGDQREATFTQAAQRVLDRVAGAGIDVEFPAAPGLFDGIRMPMPAPWVCAFPEYHKSMASPLTLTAGSLHRSQGMTVPSRITCENPSSLTRSSARLSWQAWSASTVMNSPAYR